MVSTDRTSKWLQAVNESAEPLPTNPAVLKQAPRGPQRPQKGVRRRSGNGVPRQAVEGAVPPLWVMGTHGGAGESVIASLLEGAIATDHAWPSRSGAVEGQDRVLLVCRSNMAGLRSAQQAAIEYASGALPGVLAGLVIVPDAPGRLPKDLADVARIVSGAVPDTWRMPWVEEWRRVLKPDASAVPRPVRSVLDQIQLHAVSAGTQQ